MIAISLMCEISSLCRYDTQVLQSIFYLIEFLEINLNTSHVLLDCFVDEEDIGFYRTMYHLFFTVKIIAPFYIFSSSRGQ